MRRATTMLAVGLLATGGCAGPAPDATAAAQATLPALVLVGDEPVISRATVPGASAVLPGAVVEHDGTYHAFVVGFADQVGSQRLVHLSSADAISWTLQDGEPFGELGLELSDPGPIPTSVIVEGDVWVAYFWGVLPPAREGSDIWRATAPGPDGPWIADPQPVLRRGPRGAWDGGGLDFASVVRTDDGYLMAYAGPMRTTGAIGIARSADGISWTKHDDPDTMESANTESDPVLTPGLCGAFDARSVQQPRLLADGHRLLLAYVGYPEELGEPAQVGLAESVDAGASWRCLSPDTPLETTALPDGSGVHTMAAFRREGRLALLVEWLSDDGTDIWLAEQPAATP